jgi:hypothetical protein
MTVGQYAMQSGCKGACSVTGNVPCETAEATIRGSRRELTALSSRQTIGCFNSFKRV